MIDMINISGLSNKDEGQKLNDIEMKKPKK